MWSAVTGSVTVLLVSHDGARWLPAVLDGLAAQTHRPDGLVAVDTGSRDASRALLRERLGNDAVLTAPARSSFAAAVRAGLERLPPSEWVWLLHDDSNPAPRALELLLAAAEATPTASVLGPKLREWPSLRRLLEVGVTISGTGRRETGLERGEYDQGQHDRQRDVLAVNTAGMLVRRSVLESLGFEHRLPVFGNDIDFGWRAARAGHRTVVVPDAVVFHVEAAHRGVRRTELTGSFRRGERRAAIFLVLANCSLPALPFQAVRLFLGGVLRVLGLLLVRAPLEAWDELVGTLAAYAHPFRILRARLRRSRSATVRRRDVRPLLAPPWVPYRHGLDFVADVAIAIGHQVGDVNAARRTRSVAAIEAGPVPDEAQSLPEDTGLVARLLGSPVAGLFALLVAGSLVAARGLYGAGILAGGSLLPAPTSALHWWSVYLTGWHLDSVGSASPAAPYLLPMAVVATLLLGKAWLLVDLLFLLSTPLAAWGAFRLVNRLTRVRSVAAWGAVAYGLVPVLSGAVAQGRLGTVVATAVLPWLASAALYLTDESRDRRRRATWRTSLWLAVLVAFAPLALPLAVVLAMVGAVLTRRLLVLVPVVAAAVLVLPWAALTWTQHGPATWLFEAGLPLPGGRLDPTAMLTGRPDGGAPWWLAVGVGVAALAALLRSDTRSRVLRAWLVVVVALGSVVVVSQGSYSVAGRPPLTPYLGFPLLVAQGAAIVAACLAAAGIRTRLAGATFGWRQPLGVVVVVMAIASVLVGAAWWVHVGDRGPLVRRAATGVPAYMTDTGIGTLVVRGSTDTGFRYVVLRGPGLRLGDDSVQPTVGEQRGVTEVVGKLVTDPQTSDIEALSAHDIGFVYAPRPADPVLVGNLDSASGLTIGGSVPGARAWQLSAAPNGTALAPARAPYYDWLLGLQGLALLVVAVLAAPTRQVRR